MIKCVNCDMDTLKDQIRLILGEIDLHGLKRFDPSDFLAHPSMMRMQTLNVSGRPLWNLARLAEYFFPFAFRKQLGIKKQIAPTTYWHLGRSYLSMLQYTTASSFDLENRLRDICDLALKFADRRVGVSWGHPYEYHGSQWKTLASSGSVPLSCAHNTARLGLLLWEAGKLLGVKDYICAAVGAAQALIELHNWKWSSDRTVGALSYYPNSEDEVINTGAEASQLLMAVYSETGEEKYKRYAQALVKMVVSEQSHDGGWRYATRSHEVRLGASLGPDNHHHAMVVRALAFHLLNFSSHLNHLDSLQRTLKGGVEYYMENLSSPNGRCYFWGNDQGWRRDANVAGYCEGILALNAAARFFADKDDSFTGKIKTRSRVIMQRTLNAFGPNSRGLVASDRRFILPYNIASIRWGSGLVLEALTDFCHLNTACEANLSWKSYVS